MLLREILLLASMAVSGVVPTCGFSPVYLSPMRHSRLIWICYSFKAIALGADFVDLGRPMLWGLAHEGEKGARHVLKSLLADFDLTVALSGHQNLSQVNRSSVVSQQMHM